MSLEKVKLGYLIEKYGGIIQTGPFGSQLHESDYSEEGIPVVMPKDIIDGKISEISTAKISEDIYSRLQRHKLRIGDIVLPRRGNFNKRAVITEREKGWLCGTGCIKINVNPQILDPKFFYYYISQSKFVDYIESQAIGSTMLNLSGSIVEGLEIILLPIETQRRIAEVLSRYDNLIENYQRQISILEQMAQELYREWFVRMRCPYAQASEDGVLPEGWTTTNIGDLYYTSSGGTPFREKEDQYYGGAINWVKTGELKDNFIFETEEKITELGLLNSSAKLFQKNTVLIGMYGATVGQLGILGQAATTNQASCALIQKSELFNYAYIFLHLVNYRHHLVHLSMGAAQQNISQDEIKKYFILKPDERVMQAFNKIIIPIFKKSENLQSQLTTLRQTRDALLPRLLSGQLSLESPVSALSVVH
jgi:type I restriction enzyme S subunit